MPSETCYRGDFPLGDSFPANHPLGPPALAGIPDASGINPFRNCAELVKGIQDGDRSSVERLYSMLVDSAHRQLARKVDRSLIEDKFHDVVVTVLEAILNGNVREPARLMGFVQTVTRRRVAAHVRANIKRRRCTQFNEFDFPGCADSSPEALAARNQRSARIGVLLKTLCPRDRHLLIRFYFDEQLPEQICAEMNLTPTQFRLFKSRALARCAAAGRV